MRTLSEIRIGDRRDERDSEIQSADNAADDRIDELENERLSLLDEIAGQIVEIERISKERDDWRERYEELVESRNNLALTGSC